jgi:hypothetical protein
MKIRIKYLVIGALFIISLLFILYAFSFTNWVPELEQKLTYILASFSIVFSIFQYSINNQRDRDRYLHQLQIEESRYLSQLRIEEYRQIRLLIQEFINTVNNGLSENVSLIETASKLLNRKNELANLIKSNNSKLFPGLMQQESSKTLDEIFEKILLETSKARQKYQKILDSNSVAKEFETEILKMNWDLEIRNDFKKAFEIRDNLLQYLQSLIIL